MKLNSSYLFLFCSIIFQSIASLLSKFAANDLQMDKFYLILINGYYMSAIICLILQAVFWQLTLKKIELSAAYPLTSLNNVFILIFSYFIFNEQVSLNNILGVSIIMLGIVTLTVKSEVK